MRMQWIMLIVGAAVFGLTGCDSVAYAPDGSNPVDVDPAPLPLEIDLASEPDTIVAWGQISLALDSSDPRPVDSLQVFVDEVRVTDNGASVAIDTRQIRDGEHWLRVRAFASSGTGSLAEYYGREGVVEEIERVLLVDNAPAEPTSVTGLRPEQGRLVVEWGGIDRPGFQRYRLYEVDAAGERELRATIENPSVTSWTDSLTVGGTVRFAVDVEVAGQTAVGPVTEGVFAQAEIVGATALDRTQIRVEWAPAPFPANVDRYILERETVRADGQSGGAPVQVASVLSAERTAVDTVPDEFGATYGYTLRAVAVGEQRQTASARVDAGVDPEAPNAYVVGYLTDTDAFLARGATAAGGRELIRFDGRSYDVTVRREIADDAFVRVSPSGRILVGSDVLQVLDPRTLQVTHEFDPRSVLGGAWLRTSDVEFTDDGVLIAGYSYAEDPDVPERRRNGLVAIDVDDGRLVARLDGEDIREPIPTLGYVPVSLLAASPDGRYALIETYESDGTGSTVLVERVGDGFNEIASEPVTWFPPVYFVSNRTFAVGDPFALDGGPFEVYEVPTLQPVREIVLAGPFGGGFDPTTNVLYSIEADREVIGVDVDTGDVAFQVRVAARVNGVQLVGGVLFGGGRARRLGPAG